MKKQYLVASFIISGLLVPVLVNAATVDEIRAQIQSLISQITALQAQLNDLKLDTPIVTTPSSNACPNLYRALSRGSRGSDVTSLQQFLIAQSLLDSDSATGFFGSLTETAVQRWQAQNSIVLSGDAASTGYGAVGVKTRATFAARCGTTTPPIVQSCPGPKPTTQCSGTWVSRYRTDNYYGDGCNKLWVCELATECPIYNACPPGETTNTSIGANGCTVLQCVVPTASVSLNASPTLGVAPLTTTFKAKLPAAGKYSLNFGDGTAPLMFDVVEGACGDGADYGTCGLSLDAARHTYTSTGTYTAKLIKFSYYTCLGPGCDKPVEQVIGTVTITVTGGTQGATLSASPTSGVAPLVVTFISSYGDGGDYRPSFADGQDTLLDFGDGSELQWVQCATSLGIVTTGYLPNVGNCTTPVRITHTYLQLGTYTATLKRAGGRCYGSCGATVLGTVAITVTGQSDTQSFRVVSPNGGEKIATGQSFTIRWNTDGANLGGYGSNLVTLSLIPQNVGYKDVRPLMIGNFRAGDLSYAWSPSSVLVGDSYRIKAVLNNGTCVPVGPYPFAADMGTCSAMALTLATDESDGWFSIQ